MADRTKFKFDQFTAMELESGPEMDFASHVHTYRRFVHVAGWVVFHLLVMLVALYFAVIQGNAVLGLLLIGVALVILFVDVIRERTQVAPSADHVAILERPRDA